MIWPGFGLPPGVSSAITVTALVLLAILAPWYLQRKRP
jgi:hypothetical protein